MTARIVNNRVEGSRITVWGITHYLENGRSHEYIADVLPITLEQVQVAVEYSMKDCSYSTPAPSTAIPPPMAWPTEAESSIATAPVRS